MYYHIAMRALPIAMLLIIFLAYPAVARDPVFILKETREGRGSFGLEADWRKERLFDGPGWVMGSVSRGDGTVMEGGYTVVHPPKGEPFVLPNCYILEAFNLRPSGTLAVTIRDPEYYHAEAPFPPEVPDRIELVWYDKNWEEYDSMYLDFEAGSTPDNFIIDSEQKHIMLANRFIDSEGSLVMPGQFLQQVNLIDGKIEDVWLPEYDYTGAPPSAWLPVMMKFDDDGDLVVQAGDQLRVYQVQW